MSRWNGRMGKGAMVQVRAKKRKEAEEEIAEMANTNEKENENTGGGKYRKENETPKRQLRTEDDAVSREYGSRALSDEESEDH